MIKLRGLGLHFVQNTELPLFQTHLVLVSFLLIGPDLANVPRELT